MGHSVTDQAQADLDDIWYYLAKATGNANIADQVIDAITDRFYLLSEHPWLGRARDHDRGRGRRSIPVDAYIIVYRVHDGDAQILRVAHSRKDLIALMSF